jgi:hypothetical protein
VLPVDCNTRKIRAVDQDSLNSDPDPVFQVNPNPDTEQDSDPIGIQSFDGQKLKKKISDLIKNCNLLMSKLQEKPSDLIRSRENIQHFKNEIY